MKLKEDNELFKNGLKHTRHRQEILQLLKKSSQPVSAEQIFSELKDLKISINLSTVYRILEMLSNSEIVTKINIGMDNKNLYEYNCMIHRHYLVCLNCSKIFTVKNCPLNDYEKELEKDTDFNITGHKLIMYGYCLDCNNAIKLTEIL